MAEEQEPESPWDEERRGGLRIETEMWVRVIGRESDPVRRSGDICATGFFFEADNWPGRTGDIGVMEVSSEDQVHSFTTMASLARVVRGDDARWSSIEPGVSFQFLPSDEATRASIARTVRYIAEQHPEQAGELGIRGFQAAAVEGAYPGAADNARPCVETGAKVRLLVDASAGGSKREVTGVVGDITESVQADGATRFWVPIFLVEDESAGESAALENSDSAETLEAPVNAEKQEALAGAESLIDDMWKELVPEARSVLGDAEADAGESSSGGKSHLSGRLSQISMPSALWLLDQERLTGALEFRRADEEVVLFLSEGRVIDAESPNSVLSPREHLSALMSWDDGEFEFHVEPVDREDRLGVPTQGLLLDLAVASDEAGR
ncbi:MAG: DUF4388 domain-containing protein [Deltaproteobacteria bacterium]|nr:DUF4388 domain-containing protein [Deltaproteobacteria bacterium]